MILINIIKAINLTIVCRLNLKVREQGGQVGGNCKSPGKKLQVTETGL